MSNLKKCFLCSSNDFKVTTDEKNKYKIKCECGITLEANSRNLLIEKWNKRKNYNDGYHSFDDLYRHRHVLLSALATLYTTTKSLKHFDEEENPMFENSFIVQMRMPSGQISYHLPIGLYENFSAIEKERASKWDGHTSEDVVRRLFHFARIDYDELDFDF